MFLLNYSHYSILLCLVLNFPFIYSNEGFIYNYFENGNDWEYHCAEVMKHNLLLKKFEILNLRDIANHQLISQIKLFEIVIGSALTYI